MTILEFRDILEKAAKEQNITSFEIFAQQGVNQSISAHEGKIKKYSNGGTIGVNLKVIENNRVGYASTEKLTKEEAEKLLQQALENAKHLPEDKSETLFDDTTPIALAEQNLTLDNSKVLEEKVLAMEKAAKDFSKAITAVSHCQMAQSASETYLFNSNGLNKVRANQLVYAVTGSVAKDEIETYNQFEYGFEKTLDKLNTKEIGQKASKDTLRYLNSAPLKTGNYPVVFENGAAIDLLSTFSGVFSLENAEKGLSLLKDKVSTQIASDVVTLKDSPYSELSGLNCPFDDQGVTVTEKNVIEKGTLTTLLNNLKWANKTKVTPTGNGFKGGYSSPVSISPCNFYIEKGSVTLDQMLEPIETGVFITSIGGLHAGANVSTGDFSLEAKGFKIEKGKVTTPLKAFTVSGNFYKVLQKITNVADDLKFDVPGSFNAYGSPSILVDDLSLAGQ